MSLDATPGLRPLGIGELLDASLRVCTRHWKVLLITVAIVTIPIQLLAGVVTAATLPDDFLQDDSAVAGSGDASYVLGQVITTVFAGLSFLVATGACFQAIGEAYLGRTPDWRRSLRFGLRRAPALLWISILYGLGVVFGAIALIIPGIWLYTAWALCYPVLFVEGTKGPGALRRSFGLVRGRWWPTFGVLLVGFLLAGFVGGIVGFGAGILVVVQPESQLFFVIFTTVGGALAALISTPFQAAITALVYFDLRVRKEGLDLEITAQRLGAQGETSGTPGIFEPRTIAPAGPIQWAVDEQGSPLPPEPPAAPGGAPPPPSPPSPDDDPPRGRIFEP